MSKKKQKKKKYYAVKEGKGVSNIILDSWSECSKLVLGYNSVYKSFSTKEEAEEYLGKVDVEKVKEQAKKGMEKQKIKKETTRAVKGFRISKELYDDFMSKCEEFDTTSEKVLKGMIEEWVLE